MSILLPLTANLLPLNILCFCLALWLGTYLFRRSTQYLRLRLFGASLLLYACTEACFVLSTVSSPFQRYLAQASLWLLFPMLFLAFCAITWSVLRRYRTSLCALLALIVVLVGTLLWFPHTLLHLLVCATLCVSGIALAAQDVNEEREALWPDLLRSLDYAMLTALVFGGQAALIMLFGAGVTLLSLLFLLSMLASAIVLQVYSRAIVTVLDTIAFATFPQLREARAELHTTIDVLPRIEQEVSLDDLDEAEFTRLTRRALSQFGDIARLGSNPLTRHPLIKARVRARGIKDDDVLEHAAELKTCLQESIERLKPRDRGAFGTSDEWRYYNALYFPYIVGIKPYSRRLQHPPSDPVVREALDWFRVQVPERTLHNWQNTAAKLIAQDLRNQSVAPEKTGARL